MCFKNKVVLITGASSGIGAATAIKLAKESAKIAIVGRNKTKLLNVSVKCENLGTKPLVIIADVTKDEDVVRLVNETVTYFGKLDVLVNNAGSVFRGSIFADNAINVFDMMMNTNLRSAVHITNLAAKHLVESKGCIVNVGSIGGRGFFVPENFSYGVSKAGLEYFTKSAALEFSSKGVRVNVVLPGPTITDCLDSSGLDEDGKVQQWRKLGGKTALGKVSEADEIADVIVFLASDKAKSVTGASYVVDNGMLLKGLH
ncbi:3-oxoacyl-[acyl-carrier-protein] reductase FabG [Manduca sexta]|uniref:3-oxoacyl-[acyl-carrier-protein] reductase FabG n=1 Tax=Manduca sexta TaxID=7130 RepID=UPI0018901D02|nr:3-oxoacyl-[acyl-carrier-protein] reductase FabG [Manduca sexta]